jgi:hypothetical protein
MCAYYKHSFLVASKFLGMGDQVISKNVTMKKKNDKNKEKLTFLQKLRKDTGKLCEKF